MELTLSESITNFDLSLPDEPTSQLPRLELLRLMAMSREGDRREGILLRQGKGWFQVSAMGHEALAAIMYALRPDDYFFPYYRDRAMAMAKGISNYDLALAYFAKKAAKGGGRQMPSHFNDPALNIFPVATPTASQNLPAVGAAWAMQLSGKDSVVVTTVGDASTRQGEFYEALAFAIQEKMPVIFVVEDNRYGISTPTEKMTPLNLGLLSESVVRRVNGRDVDAVYAASVDAVAKARRGDGPTLLWFELDRLCSHTSSDDQRLYRCVEDLTADMMRDPIDLLANKLIDKGEITREAWEAELAEIATFVADDYRRAELEADPDPSTASHHTFGPRTAAPHLPICFTEPPSIVSAVNGVLDLALSESGKVVVFGEDIEDPKGGVFGVTKGLSSKYPTRVFNAPLAEATIIGTAVGLAATGFTPVFEIQFIDFITPALNQFMQQAATLRFRSNNGWQCSMVILAPYGAYLPGGSLWHSESNEGMWAHIHGVNVVIPSTPEDAAGLLWTAIHGSDPTLFLLPKHIFRKRGQAHQEVDALPLGKAVVRRTGEDVTLVSWGNCMELCDEAIAALGDEDISIELIDLRCICPCDYETVAQSLSKTGRLVVVHEDARTTGFGQSIISEITGREEWFNYLLSAPQLVARKDTYIAYNPILEYAVLPSVEDVVAAVRRVMR